MTLLDRFRRMSKKWWSGGLLAVGGVYLSIAGLMVLLEEQLLFRPLRYPYGDWKPQVSVEDAVFNSADGTRLHGWFLPHESPRHVILFSHGNAGNVTGWMFEADRLRQAQAASVLVYDYRGFGRSEGSPNEPGILADARAARAWLAQRTGVAENEILLAGRSLGTGVSVDLAAKDGTPALILISPYTSLPDVAAQHYSWLPVRSIMRNRLDSLAKIGDYHGRTIVFHGAGDGLIPAQQGQTLFAAANEPKQFYLFQGMGHNGPLPPEYDGALREFLEPAPSPLPNASAK